jgi:hypothetical protein
MSALVLRRGFPPRLVLLPAAAIASVQDGLVHARLSDAELHALAEYVPND